MIRITLEISHGEYDSEIIYTKEEINPTDIEANDSENILSLLDEYWKIDEKKPEN